MRYNLLILLLSFTVFICGCDYDDDDDGMGGNGLTGNECQSDSCRGAAICDDGFCRCPPDVLEIAPRYCLQSSSKPTFISYDQYPFIIDTLVIEFDVEPFSHTWQNGDDFYRSVIGKVYNRNPWVLTHLPTTIGIFVYPGDPTIPVDKIYIWNILDTSGSISGRYPVGQGWDCGKQFFGKFVDRNTIQGSIQFFNCEQGGGIVADSLLPAFVQEAINVDYPITFTRIQ